jgi:hypothetical protein
MVFVENSTYCVLVNSLVIRAGEKLRPTNQDKIQLQP